jgi:hypothetical protein
MPCFDVYMQASSEHTICKIWPTQVKEEGKYVIQLLFCSTTTVACISAFHLIGTPVSASGESGFFL